jgi:hypothetical protein
LTRAGYVFDDQLLFNGKANPQTVGGIALDG